MIVYRAFWLMPAALIVWLAAGQAQQRTGPARATGAHEAAPSHTAASHLEGTRPAKPAPRSITFTPEREAAALTFVRAHLAELLALLEDLKARRPAEYQRAICDFFWTSETLATIRENDPQRYALALRTWRLESQMHLLASQSAGRPADAEPLRAELEQAVQQLVDVQIESSAYEVKRLEAQVRRAKDRHQRLADRRDELVRERLDVLSQVIEHSQTPTR